MGSNSSPRIRAARRSINRSLSQTIELVESVRQITGTFDVRELRKAANTNVAEADEQVAS